MTTAAPVFIGIDTTDHHIPYGFVVLDDDCHLLVISQGKLEEVLAFLSGQSSAHVAVNAPAHPGQGVEGQDSLFQLSPTPDGSGLRQAERELQQRGVHVVSRKADPSHCLPWMRRGFALYGYLEQLGYLPYPAQEAPSSYLETHSEGAFYNLVGQPLYEIKTLEGRLQRQLILRQQGLPLSDPMDFLEEVTPHKLLHSSLPLQQISRPSELNAWMAALVAWLAFHQVDRIICLGDPAEGQIILPVPTAERI